MARDESLHLLQHALGLDDYARGTNGHHPFNTYRNHFVAYEGGRTWDLLTAHVDAGRMERHGPSELYGGEKQYCFVVTDAGRLYVRDHSPKPPKKSKGQERYERFLKVCDCYPGKFGQWLKEESKRAKEARS